MTSKSRLFLALWPQITIQEAIHCWRDEWIWPTTVSFVPPESLHLTLHFIGNVLNSRLPELVPALQVPFQSFNLSFSCPRLWENGIAVLEPSSVPLKLIMLHTSLGVALQRFGLPFEDQRYRPHITLARNATGTSFVSTKRKCVQWPVHAYALIKSEQRQKNKYSVLHQY